MDSFIAELRASLEPAAREEFREPDAIVLRRMMQGCGMETYPAPTGDPQGERASGECICDRCGQTYYRHPYDWRVIGYGNVPFLNILCDGRRVKL